MHLLMYTFYEKAYLKNIGNVLSFKSFLEKNVLANFVINFIVHGVAMHCNTNRFT